MAQQLPNDNVDNFKVKKKRGRPRKKPVEPPLDIQDQSTQNSKNNSQQKLNKPSAQTPNETTTLTPSDPLAPNPNETTSKIITPKTKLDVIEPYNNPDMATTLFKPSAQNINVYPNQQTIVQQLRTDFILRSFPITIEGIIPDPVYESEQTTQIQTSNQTTNQNYDQTDNSMSFSDFNSLGSFVHEPEIEVEQREPVKHFDLWKACTMESTHNAIYRHSFRLTEHELNKYLFEDYDNMVKLIEELRPTKYVFQLERGEETQRLHYQGFLKFSTKIRVKQLAASLNKFAYGIQIAPAYDEKALEKYCQKEKTRVAGPWCYPSNIYRGGPQYHKT